MFFSVLFIPAGVFGSEKAGPVDFTLEPILSSGWVCYIRDGDLYIKKYGGSPVKMQSGREAGVSIQSPDLQVSADFISIAWIEKSASGKRVLFKASYDSGKTFGDIVEISSSPNTAHVMSISDGKGRFYILEGALGEKAAFTINLSYDRGKTFKRYPLEIEGLSALYSLSPLIINDALYLCFAGISDGKKVVGIKEIEIDKMTARDYKILKEAESVSFIEAFKIKDSPAFIYKTAREGRFALEGFVKGNAGYEFFSIRDAEGLDIARMDYHVWESASGGGRIIVVFSAEEREKFKQRIYAAVSEDTGKNWDVRRIDNKEFDNTRAWLPRMAVDGDRAVVVWEDSRDIRSGVRMKLSNDRGKTWKEPDIPVSDSRKFAFRPGISFTDKAFYIAWHQFRDDEKKAADIFLTKLSWDETIKMASKKEKGISSKKKEAILRERVNAYWKGMMKKDNKITYAIHDPFFRAKVPYDSYASRKSPMVYHSFSIEGFKIEGNIAAVKLKIKYDVPKIVMFGKETSIPMKEVVAEDAYLFIDGTWHRKFVDAMSGGSAVDY